MYILTSVRLSSHIKSIEIHQISFSRSLSFSGNQNKCIPFLSRTYLQHLLLLFQMLAERNVRLTEQKVQLQSTIRTISLRDTNHPLRSTIETSFSLKASTINFFTYYIYMYVQIIFFKNRKCFHENNGLSRCLKNKILPCDKGKVTILEEEHFLSFVPFK